MNRPGNFLSQKLVKVFKVFKYVILGTVLVALAFLRGVLGGHSDKSIDAKKLSKDDLQKLLHVSKANADVTGDGDGDDDDDGDDGDDGDDSDDGGGC
ncbi:MAG: hypothetical protein AAB586_01880 [Patescibacteria group bacterium]